MNILWPGHNMFRILVGLTFIGAILLVFLSTSKKDFENCVSLHGEKFALNRKKLLSIVGLALLIFTALAWLINIFVGEA